MGNQPGNSSTHISVSPLVREPPASLTNFRENINVYEKIDKLSSKSGNNNNNNNDEQKLNIEGVICKPEPIFQTNCFEMQYGSTDGNNSTNKFLSDMSFYELKQFIDSYFRYIMNDQEYRSKSIYFGVIDIIFNYFDTYIYHFRCLDSLFAKMILFNSVDMKHNNNINSENQRNLGDHLGIMLKNDDKFINNLNNNNTINIPNEFIFGYNISCLSIPKPKPKKSKLKLKVKSKSQSQSQSSKSKTKSKTRKRKISLKNNKNEKHKHKDKKHIKFSFPKRNKIAAPDDGVRTDPADDFPELIDENSNSSQQEKETEINHDNDDEDVDVDDDQVNDEQKDYLDELQEEHDNLQEQSPQSTHSEYKHDCNYSLQIGVFAMTYKQAVYFIRNFPKEHRFTHSKFHQLLTNRQFRQKFGVMDAHFLTFEYGLDTLADVNYNNDDNNDDDDNNGGEFDGAKQMNNVWIGKNGNYKRDRIDHDWINNVNSTLSKPKGILKLTIKTPNNCKRIEDITQSEIVIERNIDNSLLKLETIHKFSDFDFENIHNYVNEGYAFREVGINNDKENNNSKKNAFDKDDDDDDENKEDEFSGLSDAEKEKIIFLPAVAVTGCDAKQHGGFNFYVACVDRDS